MNSSQNWLHNWSIPYEPVNFSQSHLTSRPIHSCMHYSSFDNPPPSETETSGNAHVSKTLFGLRISFAGQNTDVYQSKPTHVRVGHCWRNDPGGVQRGRQHCMRSDLAMAIPPSGHQQTHTRTHASDLFGISFIFSMFSCQIHRFYLWLERHSVWKMFNFKNVV